MGGTRSNIQIKSLTVGPRESEDGDFRSNIEADLQQVAGSANDIHAAITRQLKFAGGIALLLHWQLRWRKERLARPPAMLHNQLLTSRQQGTPAIAIRTI